MWLMSSIFGQVTRKRAIMSRILHTGGNKYQLDIRDTFLMKDAHAQTIWIVRIEDETGYQVTSCRVAGEQDEVHKIANTWLNALCARNPGKLLATSITMHSPIKDA